jgi:hypothetical protein
VRVNVPFQGPSLKIVDASGGRKGFSIQNVSAVDVYYSDDQRTLDSVPASNLPQAGHLLAAATPALPPVVYPFFTNGIIFIRAQSNGAQVEILIYDVDLPCR